MFDFDLVINFDTVVIKVKGRLEQQQSDNFIKAIEDHLSGSVKNVSIDLTECSSISSYGVFTLTSLKEKIEKLGGKMTFSNIPENIKNIFTMLNFIH